MEIAGSNPAVPTSSQISMSDYKKHTKDDAAQNILWLTIICMFVLWIPLFLFLVILLGKYDIAWYWSLLAGIPLSILAVLVERLVQLWRKSTSVQK